MVEITVFGNAIKAFLTLIAAAASSLVILKHLGGLDWIKAVLGVEAFWDSLPK